MCRNKSRILLVFCFFFPFCFHLFPSSPSVGMQPCFTERTPQDCVIFHMGSEFLSLPLPHHAANSRIISDFRQNFSATRYLSICCSLTVRQQEMECVKQDVRVAILVYCIPKAHGQAGSHRCDRNGQRQRG